MLSYSKEYIISLEFVAGVCNSSKRTLQRKLNEDGVSYSELRDKALFKVASDMLKNPETKITEIAQLLGYNDMSHFSRSFRRIAGVTPSVYRQHYTGGSSGNPS